MSRRRIFRLIGKGDGAPLHLKPEDEHYVGVPPARRFSAAPPCICGLFVLRDIGAATI